MAANVTLAKAESQQISRSQNMTGSVSMGLSIDSDSSTDSDVTELFEDAQWSFADPVGDREGKKPGGSNRNLRRPKNSANDTTDEE